MFMATPLLMRRPPRPRRSPRRHPRRWSRLSRHLSSAGHGPCRFRHPTLPESNTKQSAGPTHLLSFS